MDSSQADRSDNATLPLNSEPDISSQASTSSTDQSRISSQPKRKYPHNYFCIQDIMSLAQRVQCTFLVDLPKLGFLDPAGESDNIAKGTKLELPFWMARDLHAEGYIEMVVPRGYNETYREILEADANVVDLHKLGPNYYQFGEHLSQMGLDDSEDIAKSLVGTFHQRFHKLVNYSLSATQDTINEVINFTNQLDNREKKLFQIGRKSVEQIKNWEDRSIEKVTANEMVVNMKKRKRAIMEQDDQ